MARFMILTFAVLGWAFWELSGGAAFAPPEAVPAPRVAYQAPEPAREMPQVIPAAYAAPAPVVTAASEFEAPEPAAAAPPADTRRVVGGRVNMRAGPGTGHPVVTVLSRGDAAEVVGTEGRWARIRAGEAEGWMALSMLSDPA